MVGRIAVLFRGAVTNGSYYLCLFVLAVSAFSALDDARLVQHLHSVREPPIQEAWYVDSFLFP